MKRIHKLPYRSLYDQYPPSAPCGCAICRSYCLRPGWWTVDEAARAIAAGYANRMMLELAPERTFGVLSPAFKGCEANFALQAYAGNGCTFLTGKLCALYGTGLQPLECRFCHHDRPGLGPQCHADLEQHWHTPAGQGLVAQWAAMMHLWGRYPG